MKKIVSSHDFRISVKSYIMNSSVLTLRSAIMAGICIGIAGFGYLALGGIAGAVLFCCGLLAVVSYKYKLYTGTAGFITKGEVGMLGIVLLGNIIGCLAVALLARLSPMPLQESAEKILSGRLSVGPLKAGLLAIGCGFLMTTAVTFARRDKWIPLLFCVPMFIVCGFPHCIADAFYYLTCSLAFWGEHLWSILLLYLCIVLGNFVGCNLYRMVMPEEK
ncbi:MAG: formate/nitrite transporter family protein [Bacteroidales bacterium]|nr:formate/nitrite transporter family protein [Bacteroidales bacterium]